MPIRRIAKLAKNIALLRRKASYARTRLFFLLPTYRVSTHYEVEDPPIRVSVIDGFSQEPTVGLKFFNPEIFLRLYSQGEPSVYGNDNTFRFIGEGDFKVGDKFYYHLKNAGDRSIERIPIHNFDPMYDFIVHRPGYGANIIRNSTANPMVKMQALQNYLRYLKTLKDYENNGVPERELPF